MNQDQVNQTLGMLHKIEGNTGGTVVIALVLVLTSFAVIIGLFVLVGRNMKLAWEVVKLAQRWDEAAKTHRQQATALKDEITRDVRTGMASAKLAAARTAEVVADKVADKVVEKVVEKVAGNGDSSEKMRRPTGEGPQ